MIGGYVFDVLFIFRLTFWDVMNNTLAIIYFIREIPFEKGGFFSFYITLPIHTIRGQYKVSHVEFFLDRTQVYWEWDCSYLRTTLFYFILSASQTCHCNKIIRLQNPYYI